jgi:tetratricopeptide (TPR) repeat protein
MHGCVSAPDTIVVARDDYDTYARRHPAIVTYLQSLLATRTFLFVGFSLTDPNFRAIYSTVQHVLGAYRRFAFATMLETGHNPHLWRYWYRKRLVLIPLQDSADVHTFLDAGLREINKRLERRTNLYTVLAALGEEKSAVGRAVRQLAGGLSHLAQSVRLQDRSPDFGVSWDDYTADERQRVYALHNFLTLMARIGLTVPAALWLRLGNTLYALEKWPLAVEAYRAAWQGWDQTSGDVQERQVLRYAQGNLARCYIALADRRRRDEGVQLDDRLASEQAEYDWAEALLREIILDPRRTEPALDWEWLAVRPPDLEEHAYVTNRLAEAAIARGRLARAMDLLHRSIGWQECGVKPIYETHLGGSPLAYALNNLAKSYRLLTEIRWAQGQFEAAQESLTRALTYCAWAVETDAGLPFPYGHVCALLGQARRYPGGDWSIERAIWQERIEAQAAQPGTVLDVGRLRREWGEFWEEAAR